MTFKMIVMDDSLNKAIDECFDYGKFKGFGQWRNAGWGTFVWEELDKDGNVIAGNKNAQEKDSTAGLRQGEVTKGHAWAEKGNDKQWRGEVR